MNLFVSTMGKVGFLVSFFTLMLGSVLSQTTVTNVVGTSTDSQSNNVIAQSIGLDFGVYKTPVTGYFTGTIDINPGSGTNPVPSNGGEDIYIQMLTNGDFYNWGRTIGGSGDDRGVEILTDGENVYVAGTFTGTVDFDAMSGVQLRTSNGGTDVFVLCLDAFSGGFNWVKTFGGPYDENVSAMDMVVTEDNLYLTGTYKGTVDLDPGSGVFLSSSMGNKDAYVTCLTTSGNFLWSKTFGGVNDDLPHDITVLRRYVGGVAMPINIAVVGDYSASIDFNPDHPTVLSTGSNNLTNRAMFIVSLGPNGVINWAKDVDSPTNNGGLAFRGSAVTFGDNANIYMSGTFDGQADFDPNSGQNILTATGAFSSAFLLKLDMNGNFLWVNQFNSSSTEINPSDIDYTAQRVYVIGRYIGAVDFDPDVINQGELYSSSSGTFIIKHRQNGAFVWAKTPTPNESSMGHSIQVYDHGCYARIAFCGQYSTLQMDLDPETTSFLIQDSYASVSNGNSGYTACWTDYVCGGKIRPINERVGGVYPNPSSGGNFNIKVEEKPKEIYLRNSQGNIVDFKWEFVRDEVQVQLMNPVSGVYLIQIQTEKEVQFEKVLIY